MLYETVSAWMEAAHLQHHAGMRSRTATLHVLGFQVQYVHAWGLAALGPVLAPGTSP